MAKYRTARQKSTVGEALDAAVGEVETLLEEIGDTVSGWEGTALENTSRFEAASTARDSLDELHGQLNDLAFPERFAILEVEWDAQTAAPSAQVSRAVRVTNAVNTLCAVVERVSAKREEESDAT